LGLKDRIDLVYGSCTENPLTTQSGPYEFRTDFHALRRI
jgi:hypothetical protein